MGITFSTKWILFQGAVMGISNLGSKERTWHVPFFVAVQKLPNNLWAGCG